jgi:hypothetical protein
MVSEGINSREDEIRFYDRLTAEEFDDLPYEEIVFREKMIAKKHSEDLREKMTVVSFGAWQQLRYKGLKMGWGKYLEELDLHPTKKKRLDKHEKIETYKQALSLHERLKKGRKK